MSVKIRPGKAASTILKPIERRDQAFLFMLRDVCHGSMQLIRLYDRDRAKVCEDAGYCRIDGEGAKGRVYLKDSGRRYLDTIVRAD